MTQFLVLFIIQTALFWVPGSRFGSEEYIQSLGHSSLCPLSSQDAQNPSYDTRVWWVPHKEVQHQRGQLRGPLRNSRELPWPCHLSCSRKSSLVVMTKEFPAPSKDFPDNISWIHSCTEKWTSANIYQHLTRKWSYLFLNIISPQWKVHLGTFLCHVAFQFFTVNKVDAQLAHIKEVSLHQEVFKNQFLFIISYSTQSNKEMHNNYIINYITGRYIDQLFPLS